MRSPISALLIIAALGILLFSQLADAQSWNNHSVSDNCPGATVACSPPSRSTFPIGQTTVLCTGTDTSGYTATCSFKVTVRKQGQL